MFRWNLMLRKLFGSLPQQSKARRPKATVKPHVEELTPRILPSASPLPVVSVASPPAVPSVAAITSYVSSMMELRSQLIATIEQDLSSVLNTIGQEIRQVIDSQWDNLMGINPSTPNASLNTTVTQPDSGMGRGNSSGVGRGSGVLAATQNTQNQTLKNSAQQTGHGSGSGSNATTASDADAPPHRLMQAQPLTGSGSTSGDTYQWDPGVGYVEYGLGSGGGGYVSTHIYTPKNLLAGNPVNWLKDGNVQVVPLGQSPTVPGNKPGDIAVLGYGSAGAAGLEPIEWNGNFTFSTLELENGYAAEETLDNNMELTGVVNSTSLAMDGNPGTKLYLYFPNGVTIKADKNETITNMTLAGFANGVYEIAGGTTTIAPSPGYQERTGVNITIDKGATLNDESYNSLQFTNSGLVINVYGTMKVGYGTGTGLLLMDNNGYENNYINVSGGALNYYGAGDVTDTFTVPVKVTDGGTFYLGVSARAQNDNGKLIVQNLSGYTFPNNLKNSVYMDGAASLVQLALVFCPSRNRNLPS